LPCAKTRSSATCYQRSRLSALGIPTRSHRALTCLHVQVLDLCPRAATPTRGHHAFYHYTRHFTPIPVMCENRLTSDRLCHDKARGVGALQARCTVPPVGNHLYQREQERGPSLSSPHITPIRSVSIVLLLRTMQRGGIPVSSGSLRKVPRR